MTAPGQQQRPGVNHVPGSERRAEGVNMAGLLLSLYIGACIIGLLVPQNTVDKGPGVTMDTSVPVIVADPPQKGE